MKPQQRNFLDRYDVWLAGAVGILALALYVRTLTPGLLPGDSGEFQTLAFLWGDTHPTGYPVYLTLAKAITWLPIHSIPWRVNLFSAIMAAGTVAGMALTGRVLTGDRELALVGAGLLMVSPTFWSQALIAEVYTPGAAFLIAILGLLLWWNHSDNDLALFLAGLLGGLSLGVHMSVAILAPEVFLFLALHWRKGWRMWGIAAAGAGMGFLITLVLFWLIDSHNPPANYFQAVILPSISAWGLTPADLDSLWERLWFGWSAQQFRPFMFQTAVVGDQAQWFWQHLPAEIGSAAPWLAAVGSLWLLWKQTRAGILLIAALSLQLLFVFSYAIWDLYVFFIPAYILILLLAVAGMAAISQGIIWLLTSIHPGRPAHWLPPVISTGLALLVLSFVIWPIFQPHREAVSAGTNPFDFEEYPVYNPRLISITQQTINKLPPNAILFTDWDTIWPAYYVAHILDSRTDLTFHETYPRDDRPELADSVIDYIEDHLAEHPIFFTDRDSQLRQAGYKLLPVRIGPTRLYRVKLP